MVTVLAVDFLCSAGLVSLCAAALDEFIFKFILALTIFCAIGFLLSTISSIAESVAYRHYKGFKWMRTKELLPVRIAIKVGGGILYLVLLIWHAINVIMVWLIESAKRFLPHRERRGALIPMALNSWRTLGAWAIGSSSMDIHTSGPDLLELVAHDEERRAVDLRAELKTREEKEKNATIFWYQTRNEEGVHLRMTITHAHLGVVR